MKTGIRGSAASVLMLVFGFSLFFIAGKHTPGSTQAPPAAPIAQNKVARIWHGRVRTDRAEEYSAYLQKEGIEKIEAIPGNLGAQVLRRTEGKVTEFMVISYWPSRDAIRAFAGANIEKTHNLPRDREFLLEMEPKVKHFDVLHESRQALEQKP